MIYPLTVGLSGSIGRHCNRGSTPTWQHFSFWLEQSSSVWHNSSIRWVYLYGLYLGHLPSLSLATPCSGKGAKEMTINMILILLPSVKWTYLCTKKSAIQSNTLGQIQKSQLIVDDALVQQASVQIPTPWFRDTPRLVFFKFGEILKARMWKNTHFAWFGKVNFGVRFLRARAHWF